MSRKTITSLNLDPLDAQIEKMIEDFKPSARQDAFREHAELCIKNKVCTLPRWIELTKEEDEDIGIPRAFCGIRQHMTHREWRMWNRSGPEFDQWFWHSFDYGAISTRELALIDQKFWNAIAEGVANGDPDKMKMYARIRAVGENGKPGEQEEELRAWAQPKKSGWGGAKVADA